MSCILMILAVQHLRGLPQSPHDGWQVPFCHLMEDPVRGDCSLKYLCELVKCCVLFENTPEAVAVSALWGPLLNLNNDKVILVQRDFPIN